MLTISTSCDWRSLQRHSRPCHNGGGEHVRDDNYYLRNAIGAITTNTRSSSGSSYRRNCESLRGRKLGRLQTAIDPYVRAVRTTRMNQGPPTSSTARWRCAERQPRPALNGAFY